MLSYAYSEIIYDQFKSIETETFEHIDDLLSTVLVKALNTQLKKGLYRSYNGRVEDIATIRGKINLTGTLHNRVACKNLVCCDYDEMSCNNMFNSIIKTTLQHFFYSPNIKKSTKSEIRNLLSYFSDIEVVIPHLIKWNYISFQRNNISYKFLLNICYFALNHYLPTEQSGDFSFQTISDSNLNRLYEKFVLNYYIKHHPNLHARAERIQWNLDNDYDNQTTFLPSMKSDIMLSYNGRILIIDTKFYGKMTQNHFNKSSIHSANLYQIFTYVKNVDSNHSKSVIGMLLYAKTSEEVIPNLDAKFDGNRILVSTLDLNQNFDNIKRQLDSIADILYTG